MTDSELAVLAIGLAGTVGLGWVVYAFTISPKAAQRMAVRRKHRTWAESPLGLSSWRGWLGVMFGGSLLRLILSPPALYVAWAAVAIAWWLYARRREAAREERPPG